MSQNSAATETFGLRFSIHSLCARSEDADALLQTLAAGGAWEREVPTETQAGPALHALSAHPMIDAVSGAAGFALTAVDVTAARKLEALKEAFLQDVQHELRTPMTAVRSALELALTPARMTSGAPIDLLGVAGRNAERLLELVDDLLDARHAASGALELDRRRIELGALVADSIRMDRPVFDFCGVRLELVTVREAMHVVADGRRLHQVLSNLLANGLKFSPPGGTVTVALDALDGAARLRVSDQGPGVPQRARERIFERGVHAAKTQRGGTGIGLYVARALVEGHDGTIRCIANEPVGATFEVVLPRCPDELRRTAERRASPPR